MSYKQQQREDKQHFLQFPTPSLTHAVPHAVVPLRCGINDMSPNSVITPPPAASVEITQPLSVCTRDFAARCAGKHTS